MAMSVCWPWKPPEGWWMSIRPLGSDVRLPGAPPTSTRAAADMAMPQHVVCTAGRMCCIVS
jgi:hypothetical protein